MPCLSGVPLRLAAICPNYEDTIGHQWLSNCVIANLYCEHCLPLRSRSENTMDTREMRRLASEATSLMAHAAATASVSISKSTTSRDKYQLRILSPLMGSLWETHHALQDGVLGQEEKVTKRLPVLLKQLEAVCKVNIQSNVLRQRLT